MQKVAKNDIYLYQCSECKLLYKDQGKAVECESWCRENHSCNLDIIQHAEPLSEDEKK